MGPPPTKRSRSVPSKPSILPQRGRAAEWLKSTSKTDAGTNQRFEAIWKDANHTVLDMTAETFALGNAVAAKLLSDARDPGTPAPTKVPEILTDAKNSLYFAPTSDWRLHGRCRSAAFTRNR